MYDNELFRLREYVNGQREYEEADQVSTQICQNLYVQATAVIQFWRITKKSMPINYNSFRVWIRRAFQKCLTPCACKTRQND